MKYIVTKDEQGKEELFAFSNTINHDAFAEGVEDLRNQTYDPWNRVFRYPISAGVIKNNECVGRSETLDLDSRPEDTILYKAQLQN